MKKFIKVFVVLIIILLFFILSISRYNNSIKSKLNKVNNLTSNMKVIKINDTEAIYNYDNAYMIINDINEDKYDEKIIYLNNYIKENNITLYYLEFSNLNDLEREKLYSSNDYFENGIVVPILLNFKNNKVINTKNIKESKKEIIEIFKR